MTNEIQPANQYPVTFDVAYPEGPRNRLTVLLRLFLGIPISIIAGLLVVAPLAVPLGYLMFLSPSANATWVLLPAYSFLWSIPAVGFGIALMLLFRRRYPLWIFDFILNASRFGARVEAYSSLLTDQYPSTEDRQSVTLDVVPPNGAELNRFLPFIKWLLALPHWIVLIVLSVAALIMLVVAWLVIIITGRLPRAMFDFLVGVSRWSYRVQAYAIWLVTDKYPPFSLK